MACHLHKYGSMEKNAGSGYLITALGGGVALVCLALGFQLLSQDLPAPVASWLQDGRIRNGLILALGGAFVSFLLGSGFMVAARRCVARPRSGNRRRDGNHWGDPTAAGLLAVGGRLGLAGQELATLASNPQPGPDSLEKLNETVVRLRETVDETEAIVNSINEISSFRDAPGVPDAE